MAEPIPPTRRYISLALVLSGGFFIWWFGSPAEQSDPESHSSQKLTLLQGQTMGTFYQVTIARNLNLESQKKLTDKIDEFLAGFNRTFSTYDPDSEISRFNQSGSTDWFPVSHSFLDLMKSALNISNKTDGYFDITVGPLVRAWNFGPDIQDLQIPTDEQIQEIQTFVGSDSIRIRDDPPALRKNDPRVQIDFSAMAKGAAVDQIAQILNSCGDDAYLVNIGGEIIAQGRKPDGKAWKLGVEQPVRDQRLPFGDIEITDIAMATSGDYRNYYRHQGEIYSHTINPKTGRPAQHGLRSVTVIDQNCADADAYATAMMAMGPEQSQRFANQFGLRVCFLMQSEEKIVPHYSQEWVNTYGETWK